MIKKFVLLLAVTQVACASFLKNETMNKETQIAHIATREDQLRYVAVDDYMEMVDGTVYRIFYVSDREVRFGAHGKTFRITKPFDGHCQVCLSIRTVATRSSNYGQYESLKSRFEFER